MHANTTVSGVHKLPISHRENEPSPSSGKNNPDTFLHKWQPIYMFPFILVRPIIENGRRKTKQKKQEREFYFEAATQ